MIQNQSMRRLNVVLRDFGYIWNPDHKTLDGKPFDSIFSAAESLYPVECQGFRDACFAATDPKTIESDNAAARALFERLGETWNP